MKVVFLESIEGTALVGEVKEVKNGFARNYLLPRGLAAPAVEPHLQRAEARARREAKQQVVIDRDASAVAERLEGARISLTARVGEQGKLFGSITSVHIAEEVAKLLEQEEFDHRKVLLPEAIKEVGVQPVRLRLTRNVEAAVEVEVLAEGEETEEAEATEAEDAAEETSASEEQSSEDGTAETEASLEAPAEEAAEDSVEEQAEEQVEEEVAAEEEETDTVAEEKEGA
ncbi:MAG: 50S ribosomal protein L9 [Chloroflexi bacterium]|nr:50S ribosomal protein L9 [Chloroflexota bacterium]